MENNEGKANAPSEPKITAPPSPPPKKPSTSGKWIAVIIGLLVVIGVLGGLLATHYVPAAAAGPSATLSSTVGAINQGDNYTANITATGSFQNMTVYFGDGSSQFVTYHGNKTVQVTHKYTNPGEYYVFADINYSSTKQGYYMVPLKVNPSYPSVDYAYRTLAVNPAESSHQLVSNISNIFKPGSFMRLDFLPSVGGGTNQIISQTMTMYNQNGMVSQEAIPYAYSISSQGYNLPISGLSYTNLSSGMYILEDNTTTAPVNTTQTVTTTVSSTQNTPYAVSLGSAGPVYTPYAIAAGSTVMGVGTQNISFTVPITNLSYAMGDQVTFPNGGQLEVSSGVNVTLVNAAAGVTVTYSNATSPIFDVNSTSSAQNYSMVPADYMITMSGSATLMFNSGVTALSTQTDTQQNFTGDFSLGFVDATPVTLSNNAPVTSSTAQSYDAGTAFSGLSGATAAFSQLTNMTVTNGTHFTTANALELNMTTGSNVTLVGSGSIINATGVSAYQVDGYYMLNASEIYTISAGATVYFNPAMTQFMVNKATSTSMSFLSGKYTVTFLNKTVIGFTSVPSSAKMWQTLPTTLVLKGTGTVALNNGQYDKSKTLTSTYYIDFPVASKVTQETSTTSVFTNAEPNAPGGYTTLDPSIAYYTADSEILQNTLMQLDTYNGSSTSSFIPQVAQYLPSSTNGGINTQWQNSTATPKAANVVTTPWGTSYNYTVAPFTNYTFHINTNITFQNGQHMSAWDVMYTFTRTLLFDAGSPGTGGWVIAQYMLPGDIYSSNTFYNITQNMTVDNSTNTLTIHFQQPMPASLVYQIFESSGTWIEPASWFEAHGAGITWTATGFANYQAQGSLSGYNSYVQNHVMADGPYMISYIVPGSQVALVKNPSFVAPNAYYHAASIDRVNILYLSSNEQAFLLLKSGQATSAALPTTYWNQTQDMVKAGTLQKHNFATLSLYFYTFTLNTNIQELKNSVYSSANLPSNFFLNPNVRKAFAYAYNYSLYYNQQWGNEIYNTTFMSPYAGMLPAGMLYNQSITALTDAHAQVIDHGNGLQNFQLKEAQHYWKIFANESASATDGPAAMGLTIGSNGGATLGGSALNVPIMIPSSDPVDKAGVTTWGQDLAQVIPGIIVKPVELPLTDIFQAYAIEGQNPMPISWGGWAPDYPYPTDYLLPMGVPLNTSTYMGPAGYTPWVVGNTSASVYNTSEATSMFQEISAFNKATSNATNPAAAEHWFHVVNGMIVNSTIEMYIGQANQFWQLNSAINGNDVINYQENVMIGGGQVFQYNLLSYNTTS